MADDKGLSAEELATLRRLAEKAAPWEFRWATTAGRKRRGMFVAIDLEHRKAVLDALEALETSGERGGPAIRRLLAVLETMIPKDSQRLPANQAAIAKRAGLTPTQASLAFRWLARQRVLCCRSETKGKQSPTWEVYAGYASCLPEPRVLAEMDRQNAQDFRPGTQANEDLEAAAAAMVARLQAGTLSDDAFTESTDPRQRNFDA